MAWRFQFSPSLAGFIRKTPQGDLMMPAVTDTREGVVVITKPANPFVLKGMKPGETRSYSQKVAVIELDDPTDEEYSGSLNGVYTYVGTYRVTVPAGTYKSVLLVSSARGKLVRRIRRTQRTTFRAWGWRGCDDQPGGRDGLLDHSHRYHQRQSARQELNCSRRCFRKLFSSAAARRGF